MKMAASRERDGLHFYYCLFTFATGSRHEFLFELRDSKHFFG